MKEKLEQELLCDIALPEEKVIWVKYKKEILIDGKMFDVKSFRLENGQYHFSGLFDDEETALNNHFEKHTGQENERDNRVLLSSLFQLLQSVYPGDHNDMLIAQKQLKVYCCLVLSNLQSSIDDVPTPPPQA